MPRLNGNSSHGSKPITWLSRTLSWMPHCWPQKQQWVFTSFSAGWPRFVLPAARRRVVQVRAELRLVEFVQRRRGGFSHAASSLIRSLRGATATCACRPGTAPASGRPDPAWCSRSRACGSTALQVVDVHARGEALAAARADGAASSVAGVLVQLHAELRRPLEDVEELAERQIEQRGDHRDRVQDGQEAVGRPAQPLLRDRQRQAGDRDGEQQDHAAGNPCRTAAARARPGRACAARAKARCRPAPARPRYPGRGTAATQPRVCRRNAARREAEQVRDVGHLVVGQACGSESSRRPAGT